MNAVRKQPSRRRRGRGSSGMAARWLASIAPVVRPVDWSVVLRVVVEGAGDPVIPHDGWPGAPPAGTRCVAYVSVGSDAVPFSRSVEQQAAIHAYASAHGLDVIDLGCDIVSGEASLGERHGLQALVRDAQALGATHLIVQDRRRLDGVDGVDVPDETGDTAPVLSGLVLIEAEPAHLFRGYRETVLNPPLAWPLTQLSTRVDSRRISRMVTRQEPK
jgi:hypothetical protein